MNIEPRDTQTQVKHKILEKYLAAWGRIILSGLKGVAAKRKLHGGAPLPMRFVYVDCFAYVGRYSGNQEDLFLDSVTGPVPGSPIIGIRVLDNLQAYAATLNIDLEVTSILIEAKKLNFTQLLENLSAEGFDTRVKQTMDFNNLQPGEVAVVHGNSVNLVNRLLAYTTRRYTWAFYLLDPYGPSGIPHAFVQSIVRQAQHDVMINFIYSDLDKKTGLVSMDGARARSNQAHVDHWTNSLSE